MEVKENVASPVKAYLQIASDDDVAEEFGQTFRNCFYVGEVVIENTNSVNAFLAYSSSLQVDIRYYLTLEDWDDLAKKYKDNPDSSEEWLKLQAYGYIPSVRRPSTYADILAIFEYQRKSSGRQRAMDAIQSAGEIAAGAAVFVGGPAYPKAISFLTGIIIPELQKNLLWDVLLHAKNLEARSLKEIEEVPAAGSIHRVVFFPKRGIPGVIDNKLVYISSFQNRAPVIVSGSLVKKEQSVSTGSVEKK